MPGVARDGDLCGGAIKATAIKTFVNGKKVARIGDKVEQHGDSPHDDATLTEARDDSLVFNRPIVEGMPAALEGDKATCGHAISQASLNVHVTQVEAGE